MLVQNANVAFPKRHFKNSDVNVTRHVQTECDVNRKSNSTEHLRLYFTQLVYFLTCSLENTFEFQASTELDIIIVKINVNTNPLHAIDLHVCLESSNTE